MNSSTLISDTDYGKLKSRRTIKDVAREIRFTETYKAYAHLHPYLREVECLKVQTREILMPILPGDWFAGRLDRMFVGIDPERGDLNEVAYFCQFTLLKEQLQNPGLSEKTKQDIVSLMDFWKKESTYFRCRENFPEYLSNALPSDDYYLGLEVAYPMFGLGGPCLNYDKLLQLGIPGLKEWILEKKDHPDANPEFMEACLTSLSIIREAALDYARQALSLLSECKDREDKRKLETMAESLSQVAEGKPQTLHQAIQLFWLYNLCSLSKNYGRMDIYLGDFLENDLSSGRLNQEEAKEMLSGLWKLIHARGDNFNNRIIVGGKGRRNESNANLFTKLALSVQADSAQFIPQLSLRWYEGMPQEIWDKALEVIGQGSTFPIFYNDDVNIPAIEKGFNVPLQEAEQYIPYGCGEFIIDHASLGSPNAALNVAKILDVTLFNGIDSYTGERKGLALGSDFSSFEELQSAFAMQAKYFIQFLAEAQDRIYQITSQYAAYPFLSILYDNCIDRGQPVLGGGIKYPGGTLESFGNNTVADALLVIKTLVYDKKIISLERLKECLLANFEGFERERKRMQMQPKFGNDHAEADAMSLWVNNIVCESARQQKNFTQLHSFSVVLVNNGDNVTLGKGTGASADGRFKGDPLSNGNQPGAGYDQQGITALLNSMAKLDPSLHAGATHNIKFSRTLFQNEITKISSLLKGFFLTGGTQFMITVTDAKELEAAMKEPEKYGNLIVRVGGYSERFIDLPKDVQMEVMKRTLY